MLNKLFPTGSKRNLRDSSEETPKNVLKYNQGGDQYMQEEYNQNEQANKYIQEEANQYNQKHANQYNQNEEIKIQCFLNHGDDKLMACEYDIDTPRIWCTIHGTQYACNYYTKNKAHKTNCRKCCYNKHVFLSKSEALESCHC